MKKYSIALISLLSFITLFSCAGEEILHDAQPGGSYANDNLKHLTLTLHIPGTNAPATFSYSAIDENDVKTVDILVFKSSSAGEHYYKHLHVSNVRNNQTTTSKSIDIDLDAIDARLVLLANVSYLFDNEMNSRLENDSAMGNVSKQSILDRFVFDFSNFSTGNIADSDYAFPMYGESDLISANSTVVPEIKMIRAIARVDIAASAHIDGWNIDSVYVFNIKDKGFVAPSFGTRGNITETPRVPIDAKPGTRSFSFRPNAGVTTPAMEREIYITEDAQSQGSPTCIVLKINKADSRPQFYCAKIQDANGGLLPILRNYRYRITITGISGEGYDSAEEAAVMPSSLVSSEVETDELGLENIVFNSDHKLGVSVLHVNFRADGLSSSIDAGSKASIKVFTTYTNWSVTADASMADWLSIEGADGLKAERPASSRSLELIAQPNSSGQPRYGRIYIKSGTLRQEITISQDGNPNP
ncbi:MAG: BACON domain-containing protein [Tannerellaceae bacterium]|jgi:hypothetical protein|nr:BACON domain-containing protein [Tannerellaceae bacterium]